MFKKIILSILLSISIYANEINDLKINFNNIIDKIATLIDNKSISSITRNNMIIETLTSVFDFELMAKITLGRHWKQLSKIQQTKFINLYVQRMKKSYSAKVNKYTNKQIVINSITQPKKTRVILNTSLKYDENKLDVIYKYWRPKYQKKDKKVWLIYDVVISGVSIIKTDKAQFNSILKDLTIIQLMDKIKHKL
jgi:phospholipid transport system substrate-binding protein